MSGKKSFPNLFTMPLFWIFLTGFLLRVFGLAWELKDFRLGDELYLVVDALKMAATKSIFPSIYGYGGVFYYILVFFYAIYYLFGLLFGFFKNPNDVAFLFLTSSTSFLLIGRLIAVTIGLLTGFFVYKLGRALFSERVGLIACAFVMVAPVFVEHFKLAQADTVMFLFLTIAFYFGFTLKPGRDYLRRCAITGIFTGLAISSKYSAALIFFPIVINQFLLFREKKNNFAVFFKGLMLTGSFAFLFFLFGSPFWVFDFRKAVKWFFQVKSGIDVPWGVLTIKTGILNGAWWMIKDTIRQETTIGLLFIASLVHSALRRKRLDICYLAYFIIYIFAVKDWNKRMLHYIVALFPLMSVFAADLLSSLIDKISFRFPRVKARSVVFWSLLTVCFIPLSVNIVEIYGKMHKSTREMAREWVETNIPPGTKIAIDDFHNGIPLLGKEHFLLYETPATRKEVNKVMPPQVTERYGQWLRNQKYYELYSIIVAFEEPGWPPDMPLTLLDKLSPGERGYLEHVASHWHFRNIEELKRLGVKYVIFNSTTYSSLLPQGHPKKRKWFCYENFPREDFPSITIVPPFDPARKDITTVSLVKMYIFRRAADFYNSFWGDGQVKLVKTFEPSLKNFGPFIEIYEIKYE